MANKKNLMGIPCSNSFEEAMRYYDNAKTILKDNAEIINDFYDDPKYIRIAGNTLWNGCLIALDSTFPEVRKKSKTRPDIIEYKKVIAQKDRNILDYVNDCYNVLHLSMGYDGVLMVKFVKNGFEVAKNLINLCRIKKEGK